MNRYLARLQPPLHLLGQRARVLRYKIPDPGSRGRGQARAQAAVLPRGKPEIGGCDDVRQLREALPLQQGPLRGPGGAVAAGRAPSGDVAERPGPYELKEWIGHSSLYTCTRSIV